MTKPYHITPEQALEIAQGFNLTSKAACSNDERHIIRPMPVEQFQAAINAALDKVLGEQVPEGFVLVPKEPTNSMVEAAELDACGLLSVDDIVDAYRAMLATTPSPDSGEVKP